MVNAATAGAVCVVAIEQMLDRLHSHGVILTMAKTVSTNVIIVMATLLHYYFHLLGVAVSNCCFAVAIRHYYFIRSSSGELHFVLAK